MKSNNVELNVLIKGRPIKEYPHNSQVFVEGRASSEFELEVKNHNSHRVEVVLSVDGLSITDGKEAGPASTGYLVNGYGTIRIPGWKLSNAQVAAFVFTGKEKSYVEASTGSNTNTGVIGLMAYAEKVKVRHIINAHPDFYGINNQWSSGYQTKGQPRGMGTSSALRGMRISASSYDENVSASASSAQSLGTGFGSATQFNTTSVEFDRGDIISTIILYYDDAVSLKARGIKIGRGTKKLEPQIPNPFPGMNGGCVPPEGWTG